MNILKIIFNLLLSTKTAVWLLLALVVFLLFGAVLMPTSVEFESINSMPLIEWLGGAGLGASWWLLGVMAALSLLTANTLVCSAESLIKKWDRESLLLVISPQVIHIGFLFILLAHLLSSTGGVKSNVHAPGGSSFMLSDGTTLVLGAISIEAGPRGYITDYSADVKFVKDGKTLKDGVLAPNRPVFFGGYGVYLKNVHTRPARLAHIEVTREPGAPWALLGGVLFTLGTVTLIGLRMRQEGGQGS